jgi:hypothetical protein
MELNPSVYITGILLLGLLLVFILALKASRKIPYSVKSDIYKQLGEIKLNIDANLVAANRDSLVRLDSLLSKSFQLRLRNTEACGENLKATKRLFNKDLYEKLWHFHKLRNSVVHESVNVKTDDAKLAYRTYSKAIAKLLE